MSIAERNTSERFTIFQVILELRLQLKYSDLIIEAILDKR